MSIEEIGFQLRRMRKMTEVAAGAVAHCDDSLALGLIDILKEQAGDVIERLSNHKTMLLMRLDRRAAPKPNLTSDTRDFYTSEDVVEFARNNLQACPELRGVMSPVEKTDLTKDGFDDESWRKEIRYEDHGETRGFFVRDKNADFYLDSRSMKWVPAAEITDDIMFRKKWIAKSAIAQCSRPPVESPVR